MNLCSTLPVAHTSDLFRMRHKDILTSSTRGFAGFYQLRAQWSEGKSSLANERGEHAGQKQQGTFVIVLPQSLTESYLC
jgi:hypothetical protein